MSKAWKVTLSIIAGVLLLFAIAEGGIRAFISHQVTSQAPEGTSVSFGAKPVTLGLLGGKFPHMTVDQQSTLVVDGNQFTGNPAAVVEMDNVRVAGNDPVAEELHMTTTLPNEYVRAMLNQQLEEQIGDQGFLSNLITVSDVTANPEKETFTIEFTGGLAGIEVGILDLGQIDQAVIVPEQHVAQLGMTIEPHRSPDEGVELLGQLRLEVVARQLRLRPVHHADGALQPRFRQRLAQLRPVRPAPVHQAPRHARSPEQRLVAVVTRGDDPAHLAGHVPILRRDHRAAVGAEPHQHGVPPVLPPGQLAQVELPPPPHRRGGRIPDVRVVRPHHRLRPRPARLQQMVQRVGHVPVA